MMEAIDIRPLINEIKESVKRHRLESGAYSRWLWQKKDGRPRDLGINAYGCADAINILYTVNEFSFNSIEKQASIDILRSLQDPQTGMFFEATHHTFHTTAHCTGALELLDVRPLYPIRALHPYLTRESLYALLDGLDWEREPWSNSHQGAGVYAALVNAGEATEDFRKSYFEWFWDHTDEVTGFWNKEHAGKAPYSDKRLVENRASVYQYMAGGFHYLFNHQHEKKPLRYPEKVIDSCLHMYDTGALPPSFAQRCDFIEIDWLYCLTRALRQTDHRADEARERIEHFAKRYLHNLLSLDFSYDEGFNDLHALFGSCCCLAELQGFLGQHTVITEKPLRLVLDRRPFI